jgi:hypothetical protein
MCKTVKSIKLQIFTSVVNEQVNRQTNRVSVSKTGIRLRAKNIRFYFLKKT